MLTNGQELVDFLTENGCQDVAGAMKPLTKLFEFAESGKFELTLRNRINQKRLKKAVSLATGRPVSKIAFVSLANPFPKPDWMSQEVYEDSLWASLGNSLSASLWASFEASLRDSLWTSLWTNLEDSLFYYLGFCILNDQEKIDKLKPLVEFWGQCFILGFKFDEPETLLVVCR